MLTLEIEGKRDARKIRGEMGLGDGPVDVFKIFKEKNISYAKKPLKSNISGMFLRKGNVNFVLINSSKTKGHQNFTAAHELYHILFEEGQTGSVCVAGIFEQKSLSEKKADYFAANFLVPAETLELELFKRMGSSKRKPDFPDLLYLEALFGVSHSVMLIRLQQIGVLDEEDILRFKKGIINEAVKYGYDTSLYLPTKEDIIVSDYVEKARILLEDGIISEGKYEELLIEAGFEDVLFGEEVQEYEDC
ncbi:MAG TPA: ImmA/IrrE family metallo-endopeptidase [Thermoanaerobacter sp.]|nr:ImmA/IrrE family metallo-endopeptidase [Thermoanaerobacter sp.]